MAIAVWFLANTMSYRMVGQQFDVASSIVAGVVIRHMPGNGVGTAVPRGPPGPICQSKNVRRLFPRNFDMHY